jgi:hypothetical protein
MRIRPSAQTPAVTFHSVRLGEYSTISCSVLGMKPGTMRPMPFSIHTPTKVSTHGRALQQHGRGAMERGREEHDRRRRR